MIAACSMFAAIGGVPRSAGNAYAQEDESRKLVQLVTDAADLIRTRGESAFGDFRTDSRWRQSENYIFVLDPNGNMVVHPDPDLEGKNQLALKDINGKAIIRGLLAAATSVPEKPEGWYHYQWPVPGGMLPRWKSSYVRLAETATGKKYIVGSGIYNDRMEREFVVDMVKAAVGQIQRQGKSSFAVFRDSASSFIAKDAYIFIIDEDGVELVNPAFPNLEGRNLLDLKDAHGKLLIREMFKVIQSAGSGWVDYMWPKPGESVSTQKSTFVSKALLGDKSVLVGCGVYLAEAPKVISTTHKMTAPELMTLVRKGASLLAQKGEEAFPEFRAQDSEWFHDDTYFFVWTFDGVRIFHAANPSVEGLKVSGLRDVLGRPFGKMFIEAASTAEGEGWVHYMYPEPGNIFPTWKSSFVKRITFPSGKQYIVGCGIYNMDMDKAFIEDLVNHASDLLAVAGKNAFDKLRDRKGPFMFMDTYVFVDNIDGVELVNPAYPGMEGKNLINTTDARGKPAVREYIDAAVANESAWVDYYWYKPGGNTPVLKYTFVRKVKYGEETYVVGSGLYVEGELTGANKN